MKHILEQKVFFSDTDAYGVVWHGAYLRWMEMGRVEWCFQKGYSLTELENQNILLPVSRINIQYKSSARLEDIIVIETEISEFNGLSATFKQTIKSKDSGKVFVVAEVLVVAVNKDGKLYRRFPEQIASVFKKDLLCRDIV